MINVINNMVNDFYRMNGVKHYSIFGKEICEVTQRRFDTITKNKYPICHKVVKKITEPVKIHTKSDRNNERLNKFLESLT